MRRNARRWYSMATPVAALFLIALARLSGNHEAQAADLDRSVPAPVVDEAPKAAVSETLILAGGCFWGVQGVFQHVRGVLDAVAGYDGGAAATAHYETVRTRNDGTRRVGVDHLRSSCHLLRPPAADLLLGNHGPDTAQSAISGRRDPIPFGDLCDVS